jgi:amino acid adenylation domain-containing protein
MDRRNLEDIYPLSPLQKGIVFHAVYSEGTAYQEQFPLLLEGELDAPVLERAFRALVARHGALRTGFAWEGVPQPLQFVLRHAEPSFEHLDWSAEADWRPRFHVLMEADRLRGHDLRKPPLARVTLARIDARRTLLLLSMHHAVVDGWSLPLLISELYLLYLSELTGQPHGLPPAPRYRDYVAWLMARDAEADPAFWRATLAGITAPTPLPLDRGGRQDGDAHGQEKLRLDAADTARLNAAARAHGVTLGTMAQGAWALMLSRHAAARDVVFGATVSGRPPELQGIERAVGLFINTLPVRVRVDGKATAAEWLRSIQREQAEARQHEHASLVDVQGWSEVPRDQPLFESLLVFENYPSQGGDGEDAPLRLSSLEGPERSTYALTLTCAPLPAGLELRLAWDVARFTRDDARRIVAGMAAALESLADGMDRPVDAVSLLAPGEREQLAAWSAGPATEPRGETLAAAFLAVARETPDAVAVAWDGGTMTYAELDARSASLATQLRAAGAGPESVVGVCIGWTAELPVAMWGALRAGAAYLPLDPALPPARIAALVEDAGACAVATVDALRDRVPSTVAAVTVDANDPAAAAAPEGWTEPAIGPLNAAWVFYTSGSTGKPKGVVVPHGAAVAHMTGAARLYGLTPRDRMLGFTANSFDPSLEQLMAPVLAGASVAPRGMEMPSPAALAERVRALGVTVLNLPTPYWHQLATDPVTASEVRRATRLMIVGGDAMHPAAVRAWLEADGSAGLINIYGPTEAVVSPTAFAVPAGYAAPSLRMPIGTPGGGHTAWVLGDDLRLLPAGAAGEAFLGGVAVGRGYLNAPALTAARFLPDPFSAEPGARMYRSGDGARWLPDGNLEYLGRLDLQVKVRGQRVEPGEVEAALGELPGVREAAAALRGTGDAARLVAWVVPAADASVDAGALRDALRERLPDAMVPSAIVVLESLPRTVGGKLDRRSLPDPDEAPAAEYVAPRTETERTLAAIWAEVLKVEQVGAMDSFFSLGGHSLLAMQLASRIHAQLGAEVPLRTLFDHPVLADMAARIDEAGDAELAALLAEVEGMSDEDARALVAGAGEG